MEHMPAPGEKRICGVADDGLEASPAISRWPSPDIRWHVTNPGGFHGLDASAVLAAFRWAWGEWAKVCGIRPAESAAGPHVLIECALIDRPGDVLAWSELADGTSRQKRQRYDSQEPWVSVQGPGVPSMMIDLGRVACHEIGHVLGIPHIARGNLLQPLYSPAIWTPQRGDIAEAQARYGPPLPDVPPPPPPPPGGWEIVIKGTGDIASVSIPGFRVTRLLEGE